ncbi:MAG: N-formylglutamate amidohydrolase [Deltaproteobacteria bacterium]|nr:N-formylglutamate amidohydrolase [Deltaproteobacteria bacterium]
MQNLLPGTIIKHHIESSGAPPPGEKTTGKKEVALASLVLNVPYGGVFVPPLVERRLGLSLEEIGWENFRLADPCLLQVIGAAAEKGVVKGFLGEKSLPERRLVAYKYSPLVADPLGFLSGALNGTEEGGRFINRGSTGKDFPPWPPEAEAGILKKSALPYLEELKKASLELLDRDTLVLILTLRSYSSRPWDYESDRRYPRPQVCVGSAGDGKSPAGLLSFIGRAFRTFNIWPEPDWPHRGVHVPESLGESPRLFAAALSFRRDLYMDESTGRLIKGYGSLVRVLRTIFSLLEEELETVLKIRYRRKHPPKPPSMIVKAGSANPRGAPGA